jgi:putative oxidoreductase
MAETQPMNRDRVAGKSFNWRLVIGRALAVLAGAVFVYAGVLKMRDPLQFANDVSNYGILPWPVGVRLAFYLPWLEILCGLALIFQRAFAGALAITGALIFIFIGATIWAKIQGIDVACGCFGGASSNLTLTWHLVINSSILAVLIVLWFTRKPLDPAVQIHDS